MGMEITLCSFPVDMFHASGFLGQETGDLKLDAVTKLCYARARLICPNDEA